MPENKILDALRYHSEGRPGKIEVVPTKPTQTKRDLSLAYSPGVAEPCLEIAKNIDDVYKYTAKGNLVAVISNGTAVLGLGDIGPEASKPVMEGKGLLFKIFADIDVFDIELNCKDTDEFVRIVKAMEPTFGGVNLEDIKAPESFEIEERLKRELNIPIMHDDQHGTAIISGAALLNALIVVKKKAEHVRMVINGAGASAIACTKLFMDLGVRKENLMMFDSKGLLHEGRTDLDKYKIAFASKSIDISLEDALKGADVFVGLSKGNILTPKMILGMAENPIVFAMANPDPEIEYELAVATRKDLIMATGRSDHPNQVNNVLGFPFIFRGALDVRATTINEAMKLAAVKAIAELAREPVPESVAMAYNEDKLSFGRNYIIPKPIDPRLLITVAPAVAKAAMDSGVARMPITDWDAYKLQLQRRLGLDNSFVRRLMVRARQNPLRVVFAEADDAKIIKAAYISKEEGIAIPILLGNRAKIKNIIDELKLDFNGTVIIDPFEEHDQRDQFAQLLFEKRQRRGIILSEAKKLVRDRNYYSAMMVETGQADAVIGGLSRNYPNSVRPALEIIGREDGVRRIFGMHVLMTKQGPLFFADTTLNINSNSDDLVELTRLAFKQVKKFNVEPRIALLSYSNFGSSKGEVPTKIQAAMQVLSKENPEIIVDGDIQANFALDPQMTADNFPFSKLAGKGANTFIFPDLASGNIAYQFVRMVGPADAIGPIIMGFKKSVHTLSMGSTEREIVNMVAVAVVDAQSKMANTN